MDIVEIVAAHGGVCEARDLTRLGVHHARLRAVVDQGLLLVIRRGCYAIPGADAVRVAEVAWRGSATCVTAAERWNLPVLAPDGRIHLSVPRHRSTCDEHLQRPRNVVWHYDTSYLSPHQVMRAIASAGRCGGRNQQLVMVDAALNRGLITHGNLEEFGTRHPSRGRWLMDQSDARTQSPAESLVRAGLRAARVPFVFQAELNAVGRVDFLVAGRLVVEVDGKDYHSDPAAFTRDRRRDRACQAMGLRTARFTAAESIFTTSAVVDEIRALLRAPRLPSRAFSANRRIREA